MLAACLLARVHIATVNSCWRPGIVSPPSQVAYTIGGMLVGIGIGKVGAYANYFLEWYAGMVWLLTIGVGWLWAITRSPALVGTSVAGTM
jgi:hypothetical protein